MPKVKISPADHAAFAQAAATAGITVDQWLADAGRARVGGTLEDLWRAVVADVPASPQQRRFLEATRVRALMENTVLVAVPDAFTRDVIESRLRPAITEALCRRLNTTVQVAVTIGE